MSKKSTEELRKQYMEHPPEGMTPEDVREMSEDDLLDMDYFLHEDDFDDDDCRAPEPKPMGKCQDWDQLYAAADHKR